MLRSARTGYIRLTRRGAIERFGGCSPGGLVAVVTFGGKTVGNRKTKSKADIILLRYRLCVE